MRRLFATASSIVLAAAWACDASEAPRADAPVDAGDAGAIDAGDGTCSVDARFGEPIVARGLGDREIARSSRRISATTNDASSSPRSTEWTMRASFVPRSTKRIVQRWTKRSRTCARSRR